MAVTDFRDAVANSVTAQRLEDHITECTQRYNAINRSLERLINLILTIGGSIIVGLLYVIWNMISIKGAL